MVVGSEVGVASVVAAMSTGSAAGEALASCETAGWLISAFGS
jgi:hypothetical protein